jgi:hypothetical protein
MKKIQKGLLFFFLVFLLIGCTPKEVQELKLMD